MATQHEELHQIALFDWARLQAFASPELRLLFHVPNGGMRNKVTAAKLKAAGVKAGVPDLCLPIARGGYHGLYIEMKYDKNKPTLEQARWLLGLEAEGHACAVCYTWHEAREVILRYLARKRIPKLQIKIEGGKVKCKATETRD